MTTHLLKSGPVSDLRTRCGMPLRKAKKGDQLGTENGLPHVDCAGCLRDLLVDERIEHSGMDDCPETRWLLGGDTGTSSITIWAVMTGRSVGRKRERAGVPRDPDDFDRCHRLLEQFPAWRARMPEVAAVFPEWRRLAAEWENLTALYREEIPTGRGAAPKLYARIRELTS